MLIALAIVAVSGAFAVLVSMYVWWSSKRAGLSATIIAVLVLTVAALLGAVFIGWLLTRAFLSGLA
jgi:hypothetical protein